MSKKAKTKSMKEADQKIRRITISESGATKESEVSLSSVRREAIDLGAGSTAMTFLLTSDAAVRITERALSRAIEKSWNELVFEREMEIQKLNESEKGLTEPVATATSPDTNIKTPEPVILTAAPPPPPAVEKPKPKDKKPKMISISKFI